MRRLGVWGKLEGGARGISRAYGGGSSLERGSWVVGERTGWREHLDERSQGQTNGTCTALVLEMKLEIIALWRSDCLCTVVLISQILGYSERQWRLTSSTSFYERSVVVGGCRHQ